MAPGWGSLWLLPKYSNPHNVIPAQAGIHAEGHHHHPMQG
jgi:hypothetical protein